MGGVLKGWDRMRRRGLAGAEPSGGVAVWWAWPHGAGPRVQPRALRAARSAAGRWRCGIS